jgi:hypothetical protein
MAGWGSIPLGITCLVGLLMLFGLSALHSKLSAMLAERKVHMKQARKHRLWYSVAKSMTETIWAIGTGMWSGLALSG